MPIWAWKLIRQADVVNAHVPQPDAAVIATLGRWLRKPVVLTYQCDLKLPNGAIHFVANQASHLANHITAYNADCIVTITQDYADNSPFLKRYINKVEAILPPIEMPAVREAQLKAFREKFGLRSGDRVIGMAARLATEKGVEYLVDAMPAVLKFHPKARVLFTGQYEGVLGEETYARRLSPLIAGLGDHWSFLGLLSDEEMACFFRIAEVTVLPSINSTEAYGMVQVESMISGTPVIASDLPGVRQAIRSTGMGLIVPPADSAALAGALIRVLNEPKDFLGDPADIAARFAPDATAREYEILFQKLLDNKRRASRRRPDDR
jgi:glycosyltransferase involved in cell wall biosynthesis